MSKFVAALCVGQKVVTGLNHGDAFSKLAPAEREGAIDSGFLDPETGRFFTEEFTFYTKQVFLVRHGQPAGDGEDSRLTVEGRSQARKCGDFLLRQGPPVCCRCSPLARCVETASIISGATGSEFQQDDGLRPQGSGESSAEFAARVASALDRLPERSLIVSHADFLAQFILEAVGEDFLNRASGGHCSVTMIDARRAVCLYKNGTGVRRSA